MTTELIKVVRSDGENRSFALDVSAMLSEARRVLSTPPISFMGKEDAFLHKGSAIDASAEILITLQALVQQEGTLKIGQAGDIGGDADGVQRYNRMSRGDKLALFRNIQIFRGLTVDKNGFAKTFKDLYRWRDDFLPAANLPRILTEMQQSYTFTEVTASMERSGVQSGSISLTAPWGGGEANYKYSQEHSESRKETNTYLTQRYMSRKVELAIDKDMVASRLIPDPAFLGALKNAVQRDDRSIDGYAKLLDVLNEYGWYVPLRYTLGGVLYATEKKKVTEYKQADKKSQEFGSSFKAAFDGIGGGAAYNNSEGEHSSSGSSSEAENVTILQIGGKAGTQNDFKEWNNSLNDAVTWNTATFVDMYPSLMLLDQVDNQTLTSCVSLLAKYHSYATVKDMQKFIDVGGYESGLSGLLNPWG